MSKGNTTAGGTSLLSSLFFPLGFCNGPGGDGRRAPSRGQRSRLGPSQPAGLGGEHGDWLVALLSKCLQAGRKRWCLTVCCGPHPAIPTEGKSHRPRKPGDAGPVLLPAGCWWIDCFLIQSNNQETLIAQ